MSHQQGAARCQQAEGQQHGQCQPDELPSFPPSRDGQGRQGCFLRLGEKGFRFLPAGGSGGKMSLYLFSAARVQHVIRPQGQQVLDRVTGQGHAGPPP